MIPSSHTWKLDMNIQKGRGQQVIPVENKSRSFSYGIHKDKFQLLKTCI